MSTRETISGLQPQAQVRFRGVPVGKVEFIGFDHKIKGNVLIRISIDARRTAHPVDLRHHELPGRHRPGLHPARRRRAIHGGAGAQRRRPAAHPAQARAAGQAARARARSSWTRSRPPAPSSTSCWATIRREGRRRTRQRQPGRAGHQPAHQQHGHGDQRAARSGPRQFPGAS